VGGCIPQKTFFLPQSRSTWPWWRPQSMIRHDRSVAVGGSIAISSVIGTLEQAISLYVNHFWWSVRQCSVASWRTSTLLFAGRQQSATSTFIPDWTSEGPCTSKSIATSSGGLRNVSDLPSRAIWSSHFSNSLIPPFQSGSPGDHRGNPDTANGYLLDARGGIWTTRAPDRITHGSTFRDVFFPPQHFAGKGRRIISTRKRSALFDNQKLTSLSLCPSPVQPLGFLSERFPNQRSPITELIAAGYFLYVFYLRGEFLSCFPIYNPYFFLNAGRFCIKRSSLHFL